jgi:hypothetical protein
MVTDIGRGARRTRRLPWCFLVKYSRKSFPPLPVFLPHPANCLICLVQAAHRIRRYLGRGARCTAALSNLIFDMYAAGEGPTPRVRIFQLHKPVSLSSQTVNSRIYALRN